jgi:DNA polymerase III sliding clamp (beta) subunit (PCNA family)
MLETVIAEICKNITPKKKSSVSCLLFIEVKEGKGFTTDLDQQFTFSADAADGYYDAARFYKLKNFSGAATDTDLVNDFPQAGLGEKVRIPFTLDPGVLNCNLVAFATKACAAPNEARGVLRGIYFDRTREAAIAIDGMRLRKRPLASKPSIDFIVPSSSAAAIDAIYKYCEVLEATIYASDSTGQYDSFLQLKGEGWEYLTKLMEGPYPEWWRVIPDEESQAYNEISKAEFAHLMAGIKALLPYANKKTNLMLLAENRLVTRCRANNENFYGVELDFVPFAAVNQIGINAEYFLQVFSDALEYETVRIMGKTALTGISIRQGENIDLLMPIRIVHEDEPIDYVTVPFVQVHVGQVKPAKKAPAKLDKKVEARILKLQESIGVEEILNILEGIDLL